MGILSVSRQKVMKRAWIRRQLAIAALPLAMAAVVVLVSGSGGRARTTRAVSYAAVTPGAAPTGAAEGAEPWQQEWNEVAAAANKEGRLVLLSGQLDNWLPMIAAFEKEFGIKVVAPRGSMTQQYDRMFAERSGGIYGVDVAIASGSTGRQRLYPAGALASVKDLMFLPEVKDESLWRGGHSWSDPEQKLMLLFAAKPNFDIAYNKNQVNPNELKSLWDLLDPKWKGTIVGPHPMLETAGIQTWVSLYYDQRLGPKFIERYLRDQRPVLLANQRDIVDGLALGVYSVAFITSGYNKDIREGEDIGLPMANLTRSLEEVLNISTGGTGNLIAIDRPANPNVQKLFVNWFLTQRVQHQWANCGARDRQSLRADVTNECIAPENQLPPGTGPVGVMQDALPDMDERQAFVNKYVFGLLRKLGY